MSENFRLFVECKAQASGVRLRSVPWTQLSWVLLKPKASSRWKTRYMYAWISFRVPELDQTRQNLSENLGIGIFINLRAKFLLHLIWHFSKLQVTAFEETIRIWTSKTRFNWSFHRYIFFLIKCVKLKLTNFLTKVHFLGFDLLTWANLLNLY